MIQFGLLLLLQKDVKFGWSFKDKDALSSSEVYIIC